MVYVNLDLNKIDLCVLKHANGGSIYIKKTSKCLPGKMIILIYICMTKPFQLFWNNVIFQVYLIVSFACLLLN
jgi:hypothetical protein